MGAHIAVQLLALLDNISSCCKAASSKEDFEESVAVSREVKLSALDNFHASCEVLLQIITVLGILEDVDYSVCE